MPLELLFLGTGTSAGVPMIGCDCDVCTSTDPRDCRTRPSVLVSYPNVVNPHLPDRHLLIDTAIEIRQQIIRHHIQHLDGILYTHAHADHIFGLDDIRRFNAIMQKPINFYAEHETMQSIQQVFAYIFKKHRNINKNTFIADLTPNLITQDKPIDLFGTTWTPIRLLHGKLPILGYRVDHADGSSLAYCTDVSNIPPETFKQLQNLDVLVLDALRYRHHPTHLTVNRALELSEQINAKQTYFTHIAHDISHADLTSKLPDKVQLAYDGLRLHIGQ